MKFSESTDGDFSHGQWRTLARKGAVRVWGTKAASEVWLHQLLALCPRLNSLSSWVYYFIYIMTIGIVFKILVLCTLNEMFNTTNIYWMSTLGRALFWEACKTTSQIFCPHRENILVEASLTCLFPEHTSVQCVPCCGAYLRITEYTKKHSWLWALVKKERPGHVGGKKGAAISVRVERNRSPNKVTLTPIH